MLKNRSGLFRLLPACLAIAVTAGCVSQAPPPPKRPDHVVFMVFDQMRPDYVDRFDLKQFKRLRESSRSYPDAYVGHLAAQTIVSHLVMSTGLPPSALPWTEEAMVDEAGVLGRPGAAYRTSELARPLKWKLLEAIPRERFLAANIQDALGGQVFAIGEKNYSTEVFGGPWASSIVTLAKASGKCTPDGIHVPEYIASNPRFTLECAETYGTGYPTVYTLDGSHYVEGRDPAHQGGDAWTTDAALEVMSRETWSGLFLTFGAIDKVSHMLAEHDGHGLQSVTTEFNLERILRTADDQLGRILDAINARGLADRTLIIVTADHGGQKNDVYLGNNGSQSCCPFENTTTPVTPPYWLDHLNRIGKLRTAFVNTEMTLWLDDRSPANEAALTRGLMDVSGITEIWALRRGGSPAFRYERVLSRLDAQPAKFRAWANKHSAELLATMAGPAAPDLVGFLADGYGFGRIGDHGGAQELVQRIPMIIHVPGEAPSTRWTPLRLLDLAPEVRRIMALK